MPLTEPQKRHLRGLGHALKPVVIIGGNGLTAAVQAEIEAALAYHELIKVRVNADDRDSRQAMIAAMCAESGAEAVQRIGHVALLFRRNRDKPKVELPRR